MHRAAQAARTTRLFSKKLGHARVRARPARECVAMIAVSGDDVIVRSHGCDRSCDDRFLANVKVTKAADLLRLILLTRALFKAADQQHEREHLDLVALV